jgi:hypothetical protein
MLDFFFERLEHVSTFCERRNYDIYVPDGTFGGVPKAFRDRPVIWPELYSNGRFLFPLIYDLYGYRAMYSKLDSTGRSRVDAVLRYILDDAYQRLLPGYGILRNGPGHYYAMGWAKTTTKKALVLEGTFRALSIRRHIAEQ